MNEKQLGSDDDDAPQSIVEVKSERTYSSRPPYDFIAC